MIYSCAQITPLFKKVRSLLRSNSIESNANMATHTYFHQLGIADNQEADNDPPFKYLYKDGKKIESELYKELSMLYTKDGVPNMEAIAEIMVAVYSPRFIEMYGDWRDPKGGFKGATHETGEPYSMALKRISLREVPQEQLNELSKFNEYVIKGFSGSALDESLNSMVNSLYTHELLDNNGVMINPEGLDMIIRGRLNGASLLIKEQIQLRVDAGLSPESYKPLLDIQERQKILDDDKEFKKFVSLVKYQLRQLGFKEVKLTKDDVDKFNEDLLNEIKRSDEKANQEEMNRENEESEDTRDYDEETQESFENEMVQKVFNSDANKMAITLSNSVNGKLKLWIGQMAEMSNEGRQRVSPIGQVARYDGGKLLMRAANYLAEVEGDIFEYITKLENSGDVGLKALAIRLNDANEPNINQFRSMAKHAFDRQQQEMYTYLWSRTMLDNQGVLEVKKVLTNRSNSKFEVASLLQDELLSYAVKESYKFKEIEGKNVMFDSPLNTDNKDLVGGFKMIQDKPRISEKNISAYSTEIKRLGELLWGAEADLKRNKKTVQELTTMLKGVSLDTSNALRLLGININHNEIFKLLKDPKQYFKRSIKFKSDTVEYVKASDLFLVKGATNTFGELAKVPGGYVFVEDGSSTEKFYLLMEIGYTTKQVEEILSELMIDQSGISEVATTINSMGNQVSTTNPPSPLTKTIDNFHHDDSKLARQLVNDPYSKGSYWLKEMASVDGKVIKSRTNLLRYELMDAVKQINSKDNKQIGNVKEKVDFTDEELLKNALMMFTNDDGQGTFNFMPLVFSDKERQLVLNAIKLSTKNIRRSINTKNGKIEVKLDTSSANEFNTMLNGALLGEIGRMQRIKDLIKAEKSTDNEITDEEVVKIVRKKLGEQFYDGHKYFYLFPSLNTNTDIQKAISTETINQDEVIGNDTLLSLMKKEAIRHIESEINDLLEMFQEEGVLDVKWNKENKRELVNGIEQDVEINSITEITLNDVKKTYLDSINIREFEKNKIGATLEQATFLATDFQINYLSGNINFTQLIGGDPSEFFKMKKDEDISTMRTTWEEYYKRLAGVIGTMYRGQYRFKDGNTTIDNNEYEQWVLNDLVTGRYAEDYAEKFFADYGKVKVTDGFEITTLLEYITMLQAHGKIPDNIYISIRKKIEDSYKKLLDPNFTGDAGYKLTKEEQVTIKSQKPLGSGRQYNPYYGGMRNHYIKTSSFPLVPEYTKGSPLDEIRKAMEKKEAMNFKNESNKDSSTQKRVNVRAVFLSGIKAGARNVINPFVTKDGDLVSINTKIFEGHEGMRISRDHFGIQTEEADNHTFQTLTMSQVNKLNFIGLLGQTDVDGMVKAEYNFRYGGEIFTGRQMKKKKETIRKEMIKLAAKELHTKLGIENNTITQPKKFFDRLKNIAAENGFGANDLEWLRANADGVLDIPLAQITNFSRLKAILMSLVSKSVTKMKMQGSSYIQVPSVGLKHVKLEDTNQNEILFTEAYTGSLKYFEKDNDNKDEYGRAYKPIQVIIPWPFKDNEGNKLNREDFMIKVNGRKIIDSSKLPKELIQTLASRVPSQSHSSMVPIEIVGFLPESMHDMIVLPDEITTQTGSDFDIDHLYTYFKNYYQTSDGSLAMETGGTSSLKKLQNDYIDIQLDVLLNKDVIGKVIAPLDMSDLKDHAAIIKELQEVQSKRPYMMPIGFRHVQNEYKSNMAGKIGVAIQAVASTLLATIEGKNMSINLDSGYVSAGGLSLFKLGFGKYKTKIKVTKNGKDTWIEATRSNADAINMIMSEAVDNAKNKNLSYLGYNKYNAGVFNTLLMLTDDKGNTLSPEFISNMMNQPAIVELTKRFKERENQYKRRKRELDKGTITKDDKGNYSITEEPKTEQQIIDAYYLELQKSLKDRGEIDKELVNEDMMNVLKGSTGVKTDETQLAVITLFRQVYPIAQELRKLSKVVNVDTNGVGKSPIESLNNEATIEEVKGSTILNNVLNVFQESDTELTEVGQMYETALKGANEIMSSIIGDTRLTPFRSTLWETLMKEIKEQKGYTSNVPVRIQEAAFKALKAYLYTSNVDRNPLMSRRFPFDIRTDFMFTGKDKNSIGDDIKKYLADANNMAGKYFLESLNIKKPTKDSKNALSVIEFNYNKLQAGTEQKLIGGFIELATGNAEQQTLAFNLTVTAYITGGTFNPRSFITLIPVQYLNIIGFTDFLKNNSIENIGRKDIDTFLEQFYNHEKILGKHKYPKDKVTEVKNNGEVQFLEVALPLKEGKYEKPKAFIGQDDIVFKYIGMHPGTGKAFFKRTPKRGGGKTKAEYDGSGDTMSTSIFVSDTIDLDYINRREAEIIRENELQPEEPAVVIQNKTRYAQIHKDLFGTTAKIPDMGIKELKEALTILSKDETSKYSGLAAKLVERAQYIPQNMKMEMVEDSGNYLGTWTPSRSLMSIYYDGHIKRGSYNKMTDLVKIRETMLHETIHGITREFAKSYEEAKRLQKTDGGVALVNLTRQWANGGFGKLGMSMGAAFELYNDLRELYKEKIESYEKEVGKDTKDRNFKGLQGWQPLTSFIEFQVAMLNKDFINNLSSVNKNEEFIKKHGETAKGFFEEVRRIFHNVISAILEGFGETRGSKIGNLIVYNNLNVLNSFESNTGQINQVRVENEDIVKMTVSNKAYEINKKDLSVVSNNEEKTGIERDLALLAYLKKYTNTKPVKVEHSGSISTLDGKPANLIIAPIATLMPNGTYSDYSVYYERGKNNVKEGAELESKSREQGNFGLVKLTNSAMWNNISEDVIKQYKETLSDTNKKVEIPAPLTIEEAIKEADSRKPIEQNFFNGYRPNSDVTKIHTFRKELVDKYGENVTTFDLVKTGERTRSTRTEGWFDINKPKVGDYVWQISKKNPNEKVLTRITDVYDKNNSKFKDNWYKEGWIDSNFSFVKGYEGAIEFEVVKEESPFKEETKVEVKEVKKDIKGFKGYKGGYNSIGKGTPQGDGKDKAMREVADGFIGEVSRSPYIKTTKGFDISDTHSSTVTSAKEINKKSKNNIGYNSGESILISITNREKFDENIHPKVIMLARNGELNGKSLYSSTKDVILAEHKSGASFVVGDMPNVDSQFIDYLQEIGANFTVYHTGNKSRIEIKEVKQEGVKQEIKQLSLFNQQEPVLSQKAKELVEETLQQENYDIAHFYGSNYKVKVVIDENGKKTAIETVAMYKDTKSLDVMGETHKKTPEKATDIVKAYNDGVDAQGKNSRPLEVTEYKSPVMQLIEEKNANYINVAQKGKVLGILDKRSKMIEYTEEQKDALLAVERFIGSDDKFFLLAGYAGTGKTTVAENIIRAGANIVMAPTNKAVKVLKGKLSNSFKKGEIEIGTIHSSIYGGFDKKEGKWIPSSNLLGSTVLVDEASMISSDVLDDLIKAVGNGKIIFLGDEFQLPPVGKNPELFKNVMFKEENKKQLKKVMRTSKSKLLDFATYLRTSRKLSIPASTSGNLTISKSKKASIDRYLNDLKEGKDSIYITATNANRTSINLDIRDGLGLTDRLYMKDKLISIGNTHAMMNGESFTIEDLDLSNIDLNSYEQYQVELPVYKEGVLTWSSEYFIDLNINSTGSGDPEYIMLFPFTNLPSITPQMITQAMEERDFPYIHKDELENGREIFRSTGIIATYGYAITAHKSQGSQWEKAYVEQNYNFPGAADRWLYTAVTRASNEVELVDGGKQVKTDWKEIEETIRGLEVDPFIDEQQYIDDVLTTYYNIDSNKTNDKMNSCK